MSSENDGFAVGLLGQAGPFPFNTGGDAFRRESHRVTTLRVRHGARIDKFGWSDERGQIIAYGGPGGEESVFVIDPDDALRAIRVWSGIAGWRAYATVGGIKFVTHKGNVSPLYGTGGAGASIDFDCGEENEVCGFFGAAGKEVDRIGVIFRPRRRS